LLGKTDQVSIVCCAVKRFLKAQNPACALDIGIPSNGNNSYCISAIQLGNECGNTVQAFCFSLRLDAGAHVDQDDRLPRHWLLPAATSQQHDSEYVYE